MKKLLSLILKLALFVLGVWMIVVNQKTIGMKNLLGMIAGLGILLGLLYQYNRKFQ